MALATSSLPVPLSPWINTVLDTGAICSMRTSTSWIGEALTHDPGAFLQAAGARSGIEPPPPLRQGRRAWSSTARSRPG